MESKKLNSGDWIFIAIVIVVIICLVIWGTSQSQAGTPEDNRLSRLSKRLKELEDEIAKEMESLSLTQEMKNFVDKKINNRFIMAKAVFLIFSISVMALFYIDGADIISSMLSGAGVIALGFTGGSFILVNRFKDPNLAIEDFRDTIRKWVCKKYGFDPLKEQELQQSIIEKKAQTEEIINELQQKIPQIV